MTQLEHQLAHALAQAVDAEANRCVFNKKMNKPYLTPAWFQPAVDALELYESQREQELMDRNRVY